MAHLGTRSKRRILVKCLGIALFCSFLLPFAALAQESQQKAQKAEAQAPAKTPAVEASRSAVGAPVDPTTYLIGAEDVLTIRVWREPELSGPVGVRPDGKISMPLIGDVQAVGITPEKLAKNITEGLSKFVTSPEVMVSVAEVNSKKYFISGEIMRPGSYPLVVPTTVLEALAIAGGFRDYADKKGIVVLRGSKRLKFNYKDVIHGKNSQQNVQLESGDHIIVP